MAPLFLLAVVALTSAGACAVGVRWLGLPADRPGQDAVRGDSSGGGGETGNEVREEVA